MPNRLSEEYQAYLAKNAALCAAKFESIDDRDAAIQNMKDHFSKAEQVWYIGDDNNPATLHALLRIGDVLEEISLALARLRQQ